MSNRSFISFVICTFLFGFTFFLLPFESASANEVGQVTADDILNVRTAPSTKGAIVGKLQPGDEVEIIEQSGDWLKIDSKVGKGFVDSSFIQLHTAVNTTPTSTISKNPRTTESSSSDKITVYVNGELLKLPIEPPIKDGRVLVPFRGIGENLGITVNWNPNTKQIEAIEGNTKVLFTINKNKVVVNNEPLAINPAPTIVKDSTVIPLRFFAESYGANVQWNEKERKVIIDRTSNSSEEPKTPLPDEQNSPIEEAPDNEETPSHGENQQGRPTKLALIDAEVSNVFEEASQDSKKLGALVSGDQIKVYKDQHPKEGWLEIEYNNQIGYIEANSIRSEAELIKGTVNTSGLNIREKPDANSQLIGQLKNGEEVIVFELEGNWAKIKYNEKWGYVHSFYLKMNKNTQVYSSLAGPKLENMGDRSLLSWSKIGNVTTKHQVIPNGVEIDTNAPNVEEWKDANHPAINRIEYSQLPSGSKIRIYLNPSYYFVVHHTTNEVKITLLNSGLAGKRIVIDAGHGDHDSGAKGATGLKEKDVNLAVALKLADLLRNAGTNVTLTRSNDTFLELADRVKVARNNDADVFMSIHSDSFNTTSQGSTTFYHSAKNPSWQQSKILSDITIKKVTSQLGTVSRGSNDKSLHVIRETEIPAILVELAFISNPNEEKLLGSDDFRQKAAQALFDSFAEFYK